MDNLENIGNGVLGLCMVVAAKIIAGIKGRSKKDSVSKEFCDERSCALKERLDRDEGELHDIWGRLDGDRNADKYHNRSDTAQ